MGYYIKTTESDFCIREKDIPKLFELVKEQMSGMKNAKGGSWQGDVQIGKWYAWVDTDEVLNATTIEQLFLAWRYELSHLRDVMDENGDVVKNYYLSIRDGEAKMGDEEVFFSTIAPVVYPESYLNAEGEDGSKWRWLWEDGKFFVQDVLQVKVVYSKPKEISYE